MPLEEPFLVVALYEVADDVSGLLEGVEVMDVGAFWRMDKPLGSELDRSQCVFHQRSVHD